MQMPLRKLLKNIKAMFTGLFILLAFFAIVMILGGAGNGKSSGQSATVSTPPPARVIKVDTTRLDSLRQATGREAVKGIGAWNKAVKAVIRERDSLWCEQMNNEMAGR